MSQASHTTASSLQPANLLRLAVVAAQLALLAYFADRFRMENPAFQRVMLLVTAGFVVHHLLPAAARLPFFVLLSFAALNLVVGPMNALRLSAVGLALIGLCHVPVHFNLRVALIALAGAGLIAARADEWFELPGYEAIWPILGSMFMFRLIVYLYDLKHRSAPFGVFNALAYFFMLPNVCYPMYPVVDYHQFNRHYFDEPTPWHTYQVGIKWILRGFIHLLIYRAISHNLLLGAEKVNDAGSLVQYMVATYSLYLLISGQFHVIVGILRLFGFNLPETHHLYFLSASFTDFWRRINIYWKDFILKIFFNPVYFSVKKSGAMTAMIVATIVSFFFTWLLHSYQWYWIRGEFPLIWQDALFWGILALLVLVNVLYEQKFGRTRRLKGQRWPISARAVIGLQTIGTFCVIATLWCLWTFQGSFSEWLSFMSNITNIDLRTASWIALGLLALGVTSAAFAHVGREHSAGPKLGKAKEQPKEQLRFWGSAVVTVVTVGAIGLGVRYHELLPLGPTVHALVPTVKSSRLAMQDREERDLGYYEDLTNTRNYNLALWELYNPRRGGPSWAPFNETDAVRYLPDQFHQIELQRSMQVEHKSRTLTLNRWGMRDREYEKTKPPGVYRIAVIGASHTMGSGVGDDETFENVLEDRLNRELAGAAQERFELLNFGVGGYKFYQKVWAFDRALEFEPDAVLFIVHSMERESLSQHLTRVVRLDAPIPYPELRERLEAEGIHSQSSNLKIRSTLWRIGPELITMGWRHMLDECVRRGMKLAIVPLPRVDLIQQDQAGFDQLIDLAQQVGVEVLDVSTAYDGRHDRAALKAAPWDDHPNAEGHQLLAESLLEKMRASPNWRTIIEMDSSPSSASPMPGTSAENEDAETADGEGKPVTAE